MVLTSPWVQQGPLADTLCDTVCQTVNGSADKIRDAAKSTGNQAVVDAVARIPGFHTSGAFIRPSQLKEAWEVSDEFSQMNYGRDRFFRIWQYLGRFLAGLLNHETGAFMSMSGFFAAARKPLRFWGPVVNLKGICNLLDVVKNMEDTCSEDFYIAMLDLACLVSDALYRLFDHVAFLERIKFLKLSVENADRLDRFIEVFWLTEIIPRTAKELICLLRIRKESQLLLKSGDPLPAELLKARSDSMLHLLRVLGCDLYCCFFAMSHRTSKINPQRRMLSGALGTLSSVIACYLLWRNLSDKHRTTQAAAAALALAAVKNKQEKDE